MDIEQITYETYDRVDRLDRDLRRHMKKEKTESGSGTTINTSEITSSIKGADDVNLTLINEKATTINSNTTTTNSNVATTLSLIYGMEDKINKIENRTPHPNFNNEVMQKLDQVLDIVRNNSNEETFEEDPYKLDMDYTGKIETNRNSTNYDCVEIFNQQITDYTSFCFLGYCSGSTYDYNLEITFTCTAQSSFTFDNYYISDDYQTFEAGTHTWKVSKKNVTVHSNKISSYLCITGNLPYVHHIKFEVFGTNALLNQKRKKYSINYCHDRLIISKVENNKGYYLELPNKFALTPNDLKKNYILDEENVIAYERTYDWTTKYNVKLTACSYKLFVSLQNRLYYNYCDKYIGTYGGNVLDVAIGKSNEKYIYSSAARNESHSSALYEVKLYNASASQGRNTKRCGEITRVAMVKEITNFLNDDYYMYVYTDCSGKNYLYGFVKINIEIGFGENVTAYFDSENPLKFRIYMNDSGYCVKREYVLNENKTEITLLSTKIIGTYDAYFETNTNDVYIIEKNGELKMYKK